MYLDLGRDKQLGSFRDPDLPPFGSSCAGNISDPQIAQADTAVTTPAKARKAVLGSNQLRIQGGISKRTRELELIALSIGVGIMICVRFNQYD